MLSALFNLIALPAHERRLLLRALPIVVATRLAMSLLSLSQLRSFLSWLAECCAAPQAHVDYAQRAALAVTRASGLVPMADSLTCALATLTLMRCRGLVGSLRVATRRDSAGRRHTYAWVVYQGRLVIGGEAGALAGTDGRAPVGAPAWLLSQPTSLPAFDSEIF